VVLVHTGGAGFEVEFIALDGTTLAVVTVPADNVRPSGGEIAHARGVSATTWPLVLRCDS
jgi:hypothetical protein